MANIANITVFDGAATPVSHTLVPVSVARVGQKIVAEWKENLLTVPDSAQVRLWVTLERMASGVQKITSRLEIPVMESVNGTNASGYTAAPKIAYVDKAEQIQYVHPRSMATGRRNARQILTNLLGNVSTSVTPASTGFLVDAIDNLILPT